MSEPFHPEAERGATPPQPAPAATDPAPCPAPGDGNDLVTMDLSSAPHEGAGSRVGRYKILQVIGEGGFGQVYMAEQEHPVRRRVALKVIKLGMDTKQVVARFEAERQALAMMDHPHIARVFEAGATASGRPYFVMELVRGVPITEYCDQNNLSTRERLELFVPVCHAVQHAHHKGVIHRDLKPGNILVTLHDGVPVPKVIDFGIAKATNHRLTERTLFTEFRQMIGTPAYMSPEQAEMSGLDVDTRSDVYSLGVILYELLTGTTPFGDKELRGKAYEEIQRIIRESEPPKPSTRLSALGGTLAAVAAHRRVDPRKLHQLVRGELDWIVMKCLEKDRTRRYETANGLAMDVKRYLNDEAVTARPATTAYRLRTFARRHKFGVAATAAVATALVLGITGTTAGLVRARSAQKKAEVAETRATQQKEYALKLLGEVGEARARAEREAARATAANGFLQSILGATQPGARAGLAGIGAGANGTAGAGSTVGTPPRPGPDVSARAADPVPPARGADVRVVDVLDRASAGLEGLKDQPEVELDARLTLARSYSGLGLSARAVEHYNRALALSRSISGAESEHTLRIAVDLLWDMGNGGDRADSPGAAAMARDTVATARRALGHRHPVTLDALNSLGLVLFDKGDLGPAEAVFRELTALVRDGPPVNHPRGTARYSHNLATVLMAQGRMTEAERIQREVVASERDNRTPSDDFRSGRPARVLGAILLARDKLPEAEAALRQAWEEQRRDLGDAHPDTAGTVALLCSALEQRGNFAEALSLRQRLEEWILHASRAGGGGADLSPDDTLELQWMRFRTAELQLRAGQHDTARATFAASVAGLQKLAEKSEPLQSTARTWWVHAGLFTGLRLDRPWAGRGIQAHAGATAYAMLCNHWWGDQSLDVIDWKALRFKIEPWGGTGVGDPGGASGDDGSTGRRLIEGGLEELWKTPDPPPGMYLLTLSVPRKPPREKLLRESDFLLIAPWDVSLHSLGETREASAAGGDPSGPDPAPVPPDTANDPVSPPAPDDENGWRALFAREPTERRTEPSLTPHRFSNLATGFGPAGRAGNFALEATTTVRVPPGRYTVVANQADRCRVWVDDNLVLDGWATVVNRSAPLELDGSAHAVRVRFATERDLCFRLNFSLFPEGPAPWAMVKAAQGGLHDPEVELERIEYLIARGPVTGRLLRDRAFVRGRCGRFKEADADLARSLDLEPDDHWAWFNRAALLLYLGETERYRTLCRQMADKFADSTDPAVCERTAKACLLLPGTIDPGVALRLADRAADKGGEYIGWFWMAKGFAEYRAGEAEAASDPDAARERFRASLEWLGRAADSLKWSNLGRATATYLRAMAESRSGRADKAREAFDLADKALAEVAIVPGEDDMGPGFNDWIIGQLIRREARGVIESMK